MPGPPAKHSSVRARQNKTSTRATLTKPAQADGDVANDVDEVQAPQLPGTIEWYPDVLSWWDDMWASEARSEWLDADRHLLIVGARVYQMMLDPATKVTAAKALASEFRQIMVQFGHTAMARRTLQWEVAKPDGAGDAKKPAKKVPAKKAAGKSGSDPRSRFRVVAGGG
ncbi:hypothetical protein [Mycobacterium sp. 23]|uniref:phage terminase small subunit n=1 Tax=Mycobacterium sp. 23 TaxID=3400424 RepID=UPI003AAE9363